MFLKTPTNTLNMALAMPADVKNLLSKNDMLWITDQLIKGVTQ